ncbi:MAG: DUF1553 domain-containing protein, partial [Planctomycetes bacterium]|nr:DUF1553 domain-containing protein [Planctomycetota bacterium]
IRQFEADRKPNRLERWTIRYLNESRFADYFGERLARGFVSTEGGAFIIYRRDRFIDWLRQQLRENRPYDEMVREMISANGLWTGRPATNFMTAAYIPGESDKEGRFDVNKLTGRSVRAFLGQRLDCSQCHDDRSGRPWLQSQFEGMAAFYAQSNLSMFGIEEKTMGKDDEPKEHVVVDRKTQKNRTVAPAVPFHPEWLPDEGSRRERFAVWITHRENRRFTRAAVNRIWALLFGRAYTYPRYAVDDLPDPDDANEETDTKLLDILGRDFRDHNYDLRRLILTITSTRAFRMSSSHPLDRPASTVAEQKKVNRLIEHHENNWAVFPLSRLRPEQVIGSMIQSAAIRTIDQNSHLFVRFVRFIRQQSFVEEYGDPGGEELVEQAGTIPQALLRMNGNLSQETLNASIISASGRIAQLSGSDRNCVETCFLVCFCRRPNEAEMKRCLSRLDNAKNSDQRKKAVEDLYWAMFNSPEFSWNH